MAASGSVVTRFAPSPTGFLHIGGARTALFNWLHARHHGGRFLLRIEDTDRARSTPEATEAIFAGLRWLGLDWDGDAVSQFSRIDRHAEVARDMVAAGAAYRCYATSEETEAFRAQARAAGQPPLFRSPWRDADAPTAPDAPYAIRLKAPRDGETVVDDLVQGRIAWRNETLDDLVLLRSDGTPTYMLAVVVDDHDMGITHVIRGDDHLTNTARQTLIYRALGWPLPAFAHIPLIHGPDGSKLSKRHGALGVDAYAKMGFLPVAMRNYLARLGWSHGDREFFTTEEAIEWFRIEDVGKAPARFDLKRLENLSGQHIRAAEDQALLAELEAYIAAQQLRPLTAGERSMMLRAMQGIKERSKTIPEMLDMAWFIIGRRPFRPDAGAERHLDTVSRRMLSRLTPQLRNASWDAQSLEHAVRSFAETEGMSLGKVAQPLRAALTGRTISPSVFDMMSIIGRDESLARLEDCIAAGVE
jgi:glutamyl-tRNA synthetase